MLIPDEHIENIATQFIALKEIGHLRAFNFCTFLWAVYTPGQNPPFVTVEKNKLILNHH